jgi:hypothetical protein
MVLVLGMDEPTGRPDGRRRQADFARNIAREIIARL